MTDQPAPKPTEPRPDPETVARTARRILADYPN